MKASTTRALLALNQRFYTRHAARFSATRQQAWPGWPRMLEAVPVGRTLRVLDAGCGNGRLAPYLTERLGTLNYLGLDRSPALLHAARATVGEQGAGRLRVAGDLLTSRLDMLNPHHRFDLVVLFSVMHHLPGFDQRARVLHALAHRLAPDGRLTVTFWRFAGTPGFGRRHLPWGDYNAAAREPVDTSDLELGDHLLTWDGDTTAPRYCHHADDAEIDALIDASGLTVVDAFDADGRRGEGNRYVVLGRAC